MNEEEEGQAEGEEKGEEDGEGEEEDSRTASCSEDQASCDVEDSMSISDNIDGFDDAGDEEASEENDAGDEMSSEEDEDISTALSALGWASQCLATELRGSERCSELIFAAYMDIEEARRALQGSSQRRFVSRALRLAGDIGSGDDGGLNIIASDSLQDNIVPEEITRKARCADEQCPVCLHAAVNVALAPCGHFLCGSCLRNLHKAEVCGAVAR